MDEHVSSLEAKGYEYQSKYIAMKKHYTKKQITEAIKYWESVLKGMDENGL